MKDLLMDIRGGKRFVIKQKQESEEGIKTGIIEKQTFVPQYMPQQFVPQYMPQQQPAQFSGIALPPIKMEKYTAQESEDITRIDMKYPLIPSKPAQGEKIMAYAHIFFDKKSGEIVYKIVEPALTNQMALDEIKEYVQEKLDVNFSQIRKSDAIGYLNTAFERALAYLKVKLDKNATDVLRYYVIRDFIGVEKIEPLINDKNIEDISCDGVNIPIYVYHKYPQLGSLRTNISFSNMDELDTFVNKLAERSGKTISVSHPLLDGTLPDGSRLQATLGSDIARHGSNFTIRMFSEKPLTPTDIIKYNTCDVRMMAYCWFLVEHGCSVLVSGGTASGKTSMLNVLSLFIKPQMKIISIEDTSELRLPHAHWVPEVARTPISEEGKVDMFELLRESLRQRPDYIIVGEVRGREAYVLFQQMAVGHPGLSTIHAENFPKLVDRMTSPPISLPPNLMQNLDLILFVKRVKQGRKYSRRVFSAIEVVGYNQETSTPITNEVFSWDSREDVFKNPSKSYLLKKICDNQGLNEKDVKKEIENRAKVLKWMVEKNITDYRQVSSIISTYYLSPEFLMQRIESS
ncbi:MAG TPA: ATPase, T2SS/T4P/T4SS family [archaeon]|nr:ATPase, T2SS/T4P/T4SS family [archaeon]